MKRRVFLRHAMLWAGAACSAMPYAALADNFGPIPLFDRTFPDPEGVAHPMSTWLGKPLIVNFWASWCPPCVKEMPDLDALHKKYPTVQFLGVGVDTASNIRNFIRKTPVSYPLLVAGHDGIQLMRDLGNQVGGLPFTVVFNAKGQEINRVLGQIKPAEFEPIVRSLSS
ncbi:MAG: TlpA family protein disulfide reductase [Candidimonas sp.]|nr:MAG: TlpA family protein disulfide reductase [Candidimonas sp.]TAM25886.1 MAG: TlpA family protein disulfide reductase [Candidimonas sp.]TAM76229.1 MAG: TlpA family protein disulfide reductase [Candidimonas sp.]